MIAENRKKPSLARQKAAREQGSAERLVVGIDPGLQNAGIAMVWYNPRNGVISNYVTPPGVETVAQAHKREKRRRS